MFFGLVGIGKAGLNFEFSARIHAIVEQAIRFSLAVKQVALGEILMVVWFVRGLHF
jgi:hypothetical protein